MPEEALYSETNLQKLWDDALRAETEIAALGRKAEMGPRAIWARLHGFPTMKAMNEAGVRMPGWASRALRSEHYRTMVELSRTEAILDEVPRMVHLKKIVSQARLLAAKRVLMLMMQHPEKVSLGEARQCLVTMSQLDDALKVSDDEGDVKSVEDLLIGRADEMQAILARTPEAWHPRLMAIWQGTTKDAIGEDLAKVIREGKRANPQTG